MKANHNDLTAAQREVVALIALGYDDKAIGKELNMACDTVRTHVGNIFARLGLDNRTQVALYAMLYHLVELADVRMALDQAQRRRWTVGAVQRGNHHA